MSVRELVVLGTASQVPTRYRNHNGYLVRWDGLGLLFDPGEGTQRQMTIAGVSASELSHVLISHFHGDHCLGLPGVVQRISLDRVPQTIEVLFPQSGKVYYDRLRNASIFQDMARTQPRPLSGAGGKVWEAGDLSITALPLDHGVETFGYRLQEADGVTMLPDRCAALGVKGPEIGRIRREGSVQVGDRTVTLDEVSILKRGQSVAVVMDTRMCDNALALAQGVDLLICESTYLSTEAREAHEHGHLTASQAGRIARDAGARRLVLTHFSQRYHQSEPFAEEAGEWHGDVIVARDGIRVAVPKREGEEVPA